MEVTFVRDIYSNLEGGLKKLVKRASLLHIPSSSLQSSRKGNLRQVEESRNKKNEGAL